MNRRSLSLIGAAALGGLALLGNTNVLKFSQSQRQDNQPVALDEEKTISSKVKKGCEDLITSGGDVTGVAVDDVVTIRKNDGTSCICQKVEMGPRSATVCAFQEPDKDKVTAYQVTTAKIVGDDSIFEEVKTVVKVGDKNDKGSESRGRFIVVDNNGGCQSSLEGRRVNLSNCSQILADQHKKVDDLFVTLTNGVSRLNGHN